MNPYIGDRPLDPPEDDGEDTCEYCEGNGSINPTWADPLGDQCPECLGTGISGQADSMRDPGEPNDYPED